MSLIICYTQITVHQVLSTSYQANKIIIHNYVAAFSSCVRFVYSPRKHTVSLALVMYGTQQRALLSEN